MSLLFGSLATDIIDTDSSFLDSSSGSGSGITGSDVLSTIRSLGQSASGIVQAVEGKPSTPVGYKPPAITASQGKILGLSGTGLLIAGGIVAYLLLKKKRAS